MLPLYRCINGDTAVKCLEFTDLAAGGAGIGTIPLTLC